VRAAGKGKSVTNDQDADAAADIAAWITQARSCDAPAIATFASGLEADHRCRPGCSHGAME